MARIQILQLPPCGAHGQHPFALIVDQYETQRCTFPCTLPKGHTAECDPNPQPVDFTDEWQRFGQQVGAAGVLVTAERVDIAGEETDGDLTIQFDHAALASTISTAVRAHLESTAASDAFRRDVERRP